ncbi:uncharacterized protein TNCV_2969551 [Trichonephila clavipes]|nr:uncharacterized protein TNCV_2969551 [Trichonephila clavipes]
MCHRNLYKSIAKTIYNKKAISAEKSILGENSTSQCYVEAKTRHRVSLVSAHVTTLEEDLKQQPLCQDSPKDVLSDSGLEIELAIPFVPNRDPPDTPQQSELGEVACIIIHQKEVVTNSSSIWADIWIKDLIPISKTSYGSSMEHMQVRCHRARSLPKPGFHHLYNCVFQQCWIDGI